MGLRERTKMILSSLGPGEDHTSCFPSNHAFLTASHTSSANAGSVCVNSSGEYSYRKLVPYYTHNTQHNDTTRSARTE